MSTAAHGYVTGDTPLDEIIATGQLEVRASRLPKHEKEVEALLKLQRALAVSPKNFFPKLVEIARELTYADSTGISLLNEPEKCFVWPAVAGPLSPYLWEGTPQVFGPCGTVLVRNASLLMIHPERHYDYLRPIQPALEEVLLVPFYVDGKAVGTIWAVIHTAGEYFDAEDKRLLESLAAFASSAYATLVKTGEIKPLMTPKSAQPA